MPPKKRGRTDTASASASHSSSPLPVSPPTWPQTEKTPIPPCRVWDVPDKQVAESAECVNREISDTWDDYDTLFYNAWLKVVIAPTRVADKKTLRMMGIHDDVLQLLEKIGLGTICTKQYPVYPEMVRQFLATVSVYYTNERVKKPAEGTLTFMMHGKRYRLPLLHLCEIYGFDTMVVGGTWPHPFPAQQDIWSVIGKGRYDSKCSTQSDIRHPVLRYVARLIANTILCKSEPGKMRLTEFLLLSYGIGDLFEADDSDEESFGACNMSVIFAQHLVSLKMKPFTGTTKKPETVGSLLTPIFMWFSIPSGKGERRPLNALMDVEHLMKAKWLKPNLLWRFRIGTTEYAVQLPNPALTTITESSSCLHFLPEQHLLHNVEPERGHSGSTPRSTADVASSSTALPATLPPDFVPDPFQKFVIENLQAIWDRVSRCTCIRPPPSDAAAHDDTDED